MKTHEQMQLLNKSAEADMTSALISAQKLAINLELKLIIWFQWKSETSNKQKTMKHKR